MGFSQRAAEVSRRQAEARAAAKLARDQERAAAADEFRRTMLPRPAAAAYLGLAESTLRDWWAAGDRGPAGVKYGTARQSRVYYDVAELDRWRADPLGYQQRARPESLRPFEPPRRPADKRGPAT